MKFFEEVSFETIAFVAEDVITASNEEETTRPGSDGGSFDGELDEV